MEKIMDIMLIFVFVIAAFLGLELIAKVPSQLHTPLMSGTNAISGITVVGAVSITAVAVKVGGKVGAVLGLKAVFKAALFAMLGDGNTVAVIIEYFLVVIVAAALWPMTFKPLNRFFEKRKASK